MEKNLGVGPTEEISWFLIEWFTSGTFTRSIISLPIASTSSPHPSLP